jgi:uncharacterized protein YukE
MALSARKIEITFQNAINQARILEECADEMEALVNSNVPDLCSELHSAWQGESAEAYINKLNLCGGNIAKNAQQLRAIAQTIRYAARRFREAELRAIELAKTTW